MLSRRILLYTDSALPNEEPGDGAVESFPLSIYAQSHWCKMCRHQRSSGNARVYQRGTLEGCYRISDSQGEGTAQSEARK